MRRSIKLHKDPTRRHGWGWFSNLDKRFEGFHICNVGLRRFFDIPKETKTIRICVDTEEHEGSVPVIFKRSKYFDQIGSIRSAVSRDVAEDLDTKSVQWVSKHFKVTNIEPANIAELWISVELLD